MPFFAHATYSGTSRKKGVKCGPLYCRFKWPSFWAVLEKSGKTPLFPWAWTSFPVETENGIPESEIRAQFRRIWDTVFLERFAGEKEGVRRIRPGAVGLLLPVDRLPVSLQRSGCEFSCHRYPIRSANFFASAMAATGFFPRVIFLVWELGC
jgi:hypothetical protein